MAFGAGCHREGVEQKKATSAAYDVHSEARQQDAFRQPDKLIAALELHAGDTVADVGAGAGYLTLRLARAVGPAGRVVATDIDGEALDELARRAAAAGLSQIEERRVKPDEPGLEAGRYDLILLAQVDHLVPDRGRYFGALLGALSKRGRIVVSNRERFRQPLMDALLALPVEVREVPVGLVEQFVVAVVPRR